MRMCENAGSIISRWRRHGAPLETKMESPTSGASAPTIRSFFGKMPTGSVSTWRASAGSLISRIERRE